MNLIVAAISALAAAALVGAIPLQLHLDTRRSWTAELETWHSPELADLPPARAQLTELPRRTPIQPQDGAAVDQPATELVERLLAGLRDWNGGRHHLGGAAGTCAQQARWNTPDRPVLGHRRLQRRPRRTLHTLLNAGGGRAATCWLPGLCLPLRHRRTTTRRG